MRRKCSVADSNENQRAEETVLIAYATVHLDSGESFDLLPFEDANDVKSKVEDLLEDWAKSGFLARGNEFCPWHRVKRIEATRVLELTRSEADRQLTAEGTRELVRMQRSFWKTKQAREKKDDDEEKGAKAAA
jgi:hypothetical protein